MLPIFHQMDTTWIAWVPALAMVAGWSTVLLESGYALAVWHPRVRSVWVVLIIGMHLGIGTFLGMWLFASIMIILNLGAFGAEIARDLERLVNARTARRPWRLTGEVACGR
jgi:hypothetical protein